MLMFLIVPHPQSHVLCWRFSSSVRIDFADVMFLFTYSSLIVDRRRRELIRLADSCEATYLLECYTTNKLVRTRDKSKYQTNTLVTLTLVVTRQFGLSRALAYEKSDKNMETVDTSQTMKLAGKFVAGRHH